MQCTKCNLHKFNILLPDADLGKSVSLFVYCVELPSKPLKASKDPVDKDLFLQLANLDHGILKSLLTCHTETMKTSAGKSKEDTEDEETDNLTQIGVRKEDIELV